MATPIAGQEPERWTQQLSQRLHGIREYVKNPTRVSRLSNSCPSPIPIQNTDWAQVPFEEASIFFGQCHVPPSELSRWLLRICIVHYSPESEYLTVATVLCLTLTSFFFSYATIGICDISLLRDEHQQSIIAFGRKGSKIRRDFERQLRKSERLLSKARFKPGETTLPDLRSSERKTFLEDLFSTEHSEDLSMLLSAMSEWSSTFKKSWLFLVLSNQARIDSETEDVTPSRPSRGRSKAPAHATTREVIADLQNLALSIETAPESPLSRLKPPRYQFCAGKRCYLCSIASVSPTKGVDLLEPIDHAMADVEVVFHRQATSVSREYINAASIRKMNRFSWACGIRDHATFMTIYRRSQIDDWVTKFYRHLQQHASQLDHNLVVLPGRVMQEDVEDMVSYTTTIRRARKTGSEEERNDTPPTSKPGSRLRTASEAPRSRQVPRSAPAKTLTFPLAAEPAATVYPPPNPRRRSYNPMETPTRPTLERLRLASEGSRRPTATRSLNSSPNMMTPTYTGRKWP